MKHATFVFLAVTVFVLGCREEDVPSDQPEAARYGEFDLAPKVLFRKPQAEVAGYLDQFENLADTPDSESGRRVLQVRDQDRVVTAILSQELCSEVHVSGRLGDSTFPKSALDFVKLRDAYGGASLYWAMLADEPKYGQGGTVLGGRQKWESLDGTAIAEVVWRLDEPNGRVGSYEMNFSNAESKITALTEPPAG